MNTMLQKIFLILTGACLILAASAGWVMAQTYTAGTASVEPRVGLFGTTNKYVSSIWTYGGAAGYYVADNVALEVEGMGLYINQTRPLWTFYGLDSVDRTGHGFGSNFNIRWHMLTSAQASLYIAGGVGGLWTDTKVPYNGYESSLTENCELGATFALTQNMNLKGAFRYMHIGEFSDHGINAFGGNVGVNFTF